MTALPLLIQALADENGRLERRAMTRAWPVDHVVLQGERLVWTMKEPNQLIQPASGMFEGFLRLAKAPASTILRYAKRWGVLRLCEHDFPAQHPPYYWPSCPVDIHACTHDIFDNTDPKSPSERADFHLCQPRGVYSRGRYDGRPWEPVEAWRMWAQRAQATLAMAAELKEGKIPGEGHWRVAFGLEGIPNDLGRPRPPQRVEEGWRELIYQLNFWLGAAEVRPFLEYQNGQASMSLGSGWGNSPLFGALAIQLALAVSGASGYAVCDECRIVYAPSRTPRTGESHFCTTCRASRKAPQRNASARYRARIKKARRLRARGESIKKVAATLQRSESTIRLWTDKANGRRRK